MDAAMDVGVMFFVAIDDRLDDLPRPLRAGGVVEVDQRHALADRPGQDREVRAIGFGIEGSGFQGTHRFCDFLSPACGRSGLVDRSGDSFSFFKVYRIRPSFGLVLNSNGRESLPRHNRSNSF